MADPPSQAEPQGAVQGPHDDSDSLTARLAATLRSASALGAGDASSRGVTLHKRTQRFEAHIWSEKKQLYLGSFDARSQAARAHDVAALKTRGARAELNGAAGEYAALAAAVAAAPLSEVVAALRSYSKSLTAARTPPAAGGAPGGRAAGGERGGRAAGWRGRPAKRRAPPAEELGLRTPQRSGAMPPPRLPPLRLRAAAPPPALSMAADGAPLALATPRTRAAAHALAELWRPGSPLAIRPLVLVLGGGAGAAGGSGGAAAGGGGGDTPRRRALEHHPPTEAAAAAAAPRAGGRTPRAAGSAPLSPEVARRASHELRSIAAAVGPGQAAAARGR